MEDLRIIITGISENMGQIRRDIVEWNKNIVTFRYIGQWRTRLNDLKGTLQTNDKLDEALLDAVSKTDKLDKLKAEVGQKGEPNA